MISVANSADPTVTPVPYLARDREAPMAANSAKPRRAPVLARALHAATKSIMPRSLAALLPLLVGCVVPPSLSVDNADAGVDSPPAIVSISTDQSQLPLYGTVSFSVGPGSITLTLLDTDLGDTLYVKAFVDYDNPNPTPARASCTAGVAKNALRSATCDITGLCPTVDPTLHDLSIVVFDRPVLDSGTPLYQAMQPGGLATSRYYHLKCTQ